MIIVVLGMNLVIIRPLSLKDIVLPTSNYPNIDGKLELQITTICYINSYELKEANSYGRAWRWGQRTKKEH